MGICNKVAGIISPVFMSLVVLSGINQLEARVRAAPDEAQRSSILDEFASKVYVPYVIMAVVLVLLALWIIKSSLPELRASEVNMQPAGENSGTGKNSIFQFPHLWLGAACIFVYVGVEVMAGDAIGTYGKGFAIPGDETKYFTSFTLGAMLVGYVIGLIAIPRFVSQQRALSISAIVGMVVTTCAFLTHGYRSVAFVASLGLANALMWPAIFPLAIRGIGKFTERGAAILVMGIAGGAIIPKLFASLKEQYNFQVVFFALMVPCYAYILFYAVRGYRQ
jgi:glucose/galactose transporter